MLEITLIAIAIPATMVAAFISLTFLLWKDAGTALRQGQFEPGDPVSGSIARPVYRGIQYAFVMIAVGAWATLGFQSLGVA